MATPPIQHSSDDLFWMGRALDLATEMRGHVWPNPPVGCVIVKDGAAVAQAATDSGGRPHAERKALDQAGSSARSATLYVTLEPCCHWGKTPPCADAIIEAGVARVVCAMRDPDPRVNGGGFAKLREAGVAVSIGACAEQAERLISGFLNRIRHGVPEVIIVAEAATAPPAGVDALIVSSQQGARLLGRRGEIDVSGIEPHCLLVKMGEFGLTSVAVSRRDPLLRALS
ncbi:MAG: bifunctional diaminohydroxyphosphoribosylaminopyrimidine deaminase/5-amino-6-(5-phosphoribosylamino)uracil reductase RibD [Pseudomonadota bacterium]